MKKLIVPVFLTWLLTGCWPTQQPENVQDLKSVTKRFASKYDHPDQSKESPKMDMEVRNYVGQWSGLKYSIIFAPSNEEEINPQSTQHDFRLKKGDTTLGYVTITTVKIEKKGESAFEILNKQRKNANSKVLDKIQKDVMPEKIGENEVYLFKQGEAGKFTVDALLICPQEAIYLKFQSQGNGEIFEQAFQDFLTGILVE